MYERVRVAYKIHNHRQMYMKKGEGKFCLFGRVGKGEESVKRVGRKRDRLIQRFKKIFERSSWEESLSLYLCCICA